MSDNEDYQDLNGKVDEKKLRAEITQKFEKVVNNPKNESFHFDENDFPSIKQNIQDRTLLDIVKHSGSGQFISMLETANERVQAKFMIDLVKEQRFAPVEYHFDRMKPGAKLLIAIELNNLKDEIDLPEQTYPKINECMERYQAAQDQGTFAHLDPYFQPKQQGR